jgi:hypothetical protein
MKHKPRARPPPTTRNIPELGILQSIFRSALRRETLGRHSKGGRRGGELKIDWTKPLPRAWPMCIDCRLDLWRGSEEAASGQRRGLSGWFAAGRMAYHCVGGQLLSLGEGSQWAVWLHCSCRLGRPSSRAAIRSASQNSAFHHEVSAIADFRCGLRGKISITSIRPW